MTKSIRLGIAGTGRMAARMVQALDQVEGIGVQAVASGDAARAEWFAGEIGAGRSFGSVAEMVEGRDIDAVYVAGRSRDHAAAAIAALRAGKPVLVEKPLAVSADEAAGIVQTARDHGCLLVENLWCLALPAYRALQAQLESGSYGRPVHLQFDFGYPVAPDTYPSLFAPEDGGAILDRAVYGVSLALQLLGPVRDVHCSAQTDANGVDLCADLMLCHEDGGRSHIGVALNALMSNTASLACTHGVLGLGAPVVGSETLTGTQMMPQRADAASPARQGGLKERIRSWPAARRLKRLRDQSAGRFLTHGPDPYLPILTHFGHLVREGKSESDLIPLSLSFATQEILHKARAQVSGG